MKKSTSKKTTVDSRPIAEFAPERSEFSPIPRPKVGINFREAEGKVVRHINYYSQPEVYQAVEIRFTDGTFLEFELRPMVQVRSAFNGSRNGDVVRIQDYGILPEERGTPG